MFGEKHLKTRGKHKVKVKLHEKEGIDQRDRTCS